MNTRALAILLPMSLWIAYSVVLAILDVGKIPEPKTEPVSWMLPLAVAACFAGPMVVGYIAGRASKDE